MNKLLIGAVALAVAVPVMAQVQIAPVAPLAPIAQRMAMTQTRDQAVAKVREHFAMMDANRDGFVAGNELQSMRGAGHQGMNHQMGERRGRRGERLAMNNPGAAFDRIDANRDGMISRDEFAKGREMRIERKVARNGAPGQAMDGEHHAMGKMNRMGGGRGMANGMGGGMRHGMMRMADLDKDGRVSLQEATTSALQRFDRVDANRDGRITPEERRSNRDMRKQMRAPKAG
ncbi:MAG: EF-hand domain-containing protein [Sphingomonas bacterium]|nr:EF-hand domain-containing protein [Sphingomonas bacterium]